MKQSNSSSFLFFYKYLHFQFHFLFPSFLPQLSICYTSRLNVSTFFSHQMHTLRACLLHAPPDAGNAGPRNSFEIPRGSAGRPLVTGAAFPRSTRQREDHPTYAQGGWKRPMTNSLFSLYSSPFSLLQLIHGVQVDSIVER